MINKINYFGNSKIVKLICDTINSILDNFSVEVTPMYTDGVCIAEIKVGSTVTKIYAPKGSPDPGGDLPPGEWIYVHSDGNNIVISGESVEGS